MQMFLKIVKVLHFVFLRLAHVFEHLTCDDVPSLDCDDDDCSDYDEAFYGYDVDAIEPPDLDSQFFDDDEEVL